MGKNKKIVLMVGFILFCLLFGGMMGYLIGKYSPFPKGTGGLQVAMTLVLMFVCVYLSYFIHIILHEAGHVIFGKATGYKFISFRILSFLWMKENGTLRLKRYNIPGTGGQALMLPPPKKEGKYPYVWYNLGGVIMNFVTAILACLLITMLPASSEFLAVFFIIYAVIGILVGMLNGIPMAVGGIPNDGKNAFSMAKNKLNYEAFYLQLYLHGLSNQGVSWKDMQIDGKSLMELKIGDEADYNNTLVATIILMKVNYYYDLLEFEKAEEILEGFAKLGNSLNPFLKLEVDSERLFVELIGKNRAQRVESIYSKELQAYFKKAKYMPSKKRVLVAYEGLYHCDKKKAEVAYRKAKEVLAKYPIKGDAMLEEKLLDYTRNCIKSVE